MTNETDILYKVKPSFSEREELTRARELKKSLVLFETDDGRIVTYDEFIGRKPIEEEPAETVAEQPAEPAIDNPAFYPLYKRINNIDEQQNDTSEYTQVIVKFTDEVNNEARA